MLILCSSISLYSCDFCELQMYVLEVSVGVIPMQHTTAVKGVYLLLQHCIHMHRVFFCYFFAPVSPFTNQHFINNGGYNKY